MKSVRRLSFAVGVIAAMAVAPAAQAEKMFVPNYTTGTVSVVDTANGKVIHTIPRTGGPYLSTVTPDGKTALIVDYDTNQLVPINVATYKMGTPIQLPGGTSADPEQIAVAPGGRMAYVAEYKGTLVPVDLQTDKAGKAIPVGPDIESLSITPNGKTAFVSVYTTGVKKVNLTTSAVSIPITVVHPAWTGVTPNGQTLWVLAYSERKLVPIRTSTDSVGTSIDLSSSAEPWGLVISPNGRMAYVNDYAYDLAYPVNLGSRSVGTGASIGGRSYFPTLTPDGKTLYTSTDASNTLSVTSTSPFHAGSTITVGKEPGQPGIVPDQGPRAKFSHKVNGSKVKFSARKSSDSEQRITKYEWNFGDGKKATTSKPTVTHKYKHAGSHTVTLTEIDNAGCSMRVVFNGQDVYCNGSKAARITHKVKTA